MISISNVVKQDFKPYIKNKQSPTHSYLRFNIKGDYVTEEFANTLKRVMIFYIPAYAFSVNKMKVSSNTSIHDNDYIKNRLSQIPIVNVNSDLFYLDPNDIPESNNYNEQITIKVKNPSQELMNVYIDRADIYVNNKKVGNKYENIGKILLFQLRHNQEMDCEMNSELGLGCNDDRFSAVSKAFYDEEEPGNILFTLESQGQFSEYDIVTKTCKNIIHKLNLLKTNPNITDDTIIFEEEDYTYTNIINYYLQKRVEYSGLSQPDRNIKKMIIKINSKNTKKDYLDSINEIISLFEDFSKECAKKLKYNPSK